MPQLIIGNKRYHLVKRITVSLELRTADDSHEIMADGESVCRAGDKFSDRMGTIWAFRNLMRGFYHTRKLAGIWFPKDQRTAAWKQALDWINGVKKPRVKMHKKGGRTGLLGVDSGSAREKA